MVPPFADRRGCRGLEQPTALFGRQPVSETHTDTAHALHPTNARRQLRAQQASIRCLVRNSSDGGQAQIDRGWRISSQFEVNTVPKDDRAVEREARLRTILRDEFADRVVIGPLGAGRRQAVQNGCLSVLQVWKRQASLRWLLGASSLDFASVDGLLRRRPIASSNSRSCGVLGYLSMFVENLGFEPERRGGAKGHDCALSKDTMRGVYTGSSNS